MSIENKTDPKIVDRAEMERQFSFCEMIKAQNGEGKHYFIRTFGCQQNEADSERMAGLCEKMGYQRTDEPDKAKSILAEYE